MLKELINNHNQDFFKITLNMDKINELKKNKVDFFNSNYSFLKNYLNFLKKQRTTIGNDFFHFPNTYTTESEVYTFMGLTDKKYYHVKIDFINSEKDSIFIDVVPYLKYLSFIVYENKKPKFKCYIKELHLGFKLNFIDFDDFHYLESEHKRIFEFKDDYFSNYFKMIYFYDEKICECYLNPEFCDENNYPFYKISFKLKTDEKANKSVSNTIFDLYAYDKNGKRINYDMLSKYKQLYKSSVNFFEPINYRKEFMLMLDLSFAY